MGNPIAAIETAITPLQTRIERGEKETGLGLVAMIRESVKKMKALLSEFNSSVVAERLNLQALTVGPLLEGALAVAENRGIRVTLNIQDNTPVLADSQRLVACF